MRVKNQSAFDHGVKMFLITVTLVMIFTQCIPYSSAKPDKPAVVRIWFRTYSYPYKLKANRDWCNPNSRNEPCSPAFHLCFIQDANNQSTCQAEVRFGGKSTVYTNRNTIRFGTVLTRGIFNPIQFYLSKWKPYPSVNLTVTHDNFDVVNNLIGMTTLHMDQLVRPAPTKWIAKWHKTTLLLRSGKMKIVLSYQSYYTNSSAPKMHMIRLRSETNSTEPDSQGSVNANPEAIHPSVTIPSLDSNRVHANRPNMRNEQPNQIPFDRDPVSIRQVLTAPLSPVLTTATVTTKNNTADMTVTKQTTTWVPTTSANMTTTEPITTTNSSHQLNDAAIAGLTVGLGILTLLVIFLSVLCYKHRNRLSLGYRPLER